jgi:hypothetical protein
MQMKREFSMSTLSRNTARSFVVTTLLLLSMLALAACGTSQTQAVVSNNASTLFNVHNATTSYRFQKINDNNDPTFNQLLGINDHSVIAGYFGSGANGHPNKGYTITAPYGQNNHKNENFPGSVQTQVTAINNHGDTAGFWVDGHGNNFGFIAWHGVFTSYQNPNTGAGTVNQLLGLNDNGIAVGFYTDASGVNHAYELNQNNGHFSQIVPPGGSNAVATGINDRGDVVGFFTASNSSVVSFLRTGKTFTEFDYPNSTNTTALGVNASDQIVGVYVDSSTKMHGFLLSSPLHQAKWQSIDDPKGVGTTTINGLNDQAQLVGFYVDAAGNTDGFLAK